MLENILKIILLIFICVISEFGAYKLIRRIDKKERKRLQNWEFDYVEKLRKQVENLKKETEELKKMQEKMKKNKGN